MSTWNREDMKRLPLLGVLTVYLFLLGCADANQALVSGNIAVTATSPSSQMHLQERNTEKDLVISDDSRRWLLRYARGLCDGETSLPSRCMTLKELSLNPQCS